MRSQPLFYLLFGGMFAGIGYTFVIVGLCLGAQDENWAGTGTPIFVCMGGLFAIIGTVVLVLLARSYFKPWRLRNHGKLVYAQITDVSVQSNLSVNGKHPWAVTCEWEDPDTHLTHIFTTNTMTLPGESATSEYPVYMDPANPKKYFVDLETRRELR
jgi:hypothetical protein